MSSETKRPMRRVQVLAGDGKYWKPGQFGYVTYQTDRGGMWVQDRPSDPHTRPGETAYLVTKSRDGRGGALWFTRDGIRFTARRR